MSKTTQESLKPCPFCAGEANFGTTKYSQNFVEENGWVQSTFHSVNCIICGSTNRGIIGHHTPEDAAVHWNTRAALSEPEAAPVVSLQDEMLAVLCKVRDYGYLKDKDLWTQVAIVANRARIALKSQSTEATPSAAARLIAPEKLTARDFGGNVEEFEAYMRGVGRSDLLPQPPVSPAPVNAVEVSRAILDELKGEQEDLEIPTCAERKAGWHAALAAFEEALNERIALKAADIPDSSEGDQ